MEPKTYNGEVKYLGTFKTEKRSWFSLSKNPERDFYIQFQNDKLIIEYTTKNKIAQIEGRYFKSYIIGRFVLNNQSSIDIEDDKLILRNAIEESSGTSELFKRRTLNKTFIPISINEGKTNNKKNDGITITLFPEYNVILQVLQDEFKNKYV